MTEIPRSRRDNDTTITIHNAYQLWVEQRDKFGFRLGVLSCENLNEIFALHLLNLHSTCTTCTARAPPATSIISAGHGPEEPEATEATSTSADGDCMRSRRMESRETLKLKVKPPSPTPRPTQPALPHVTLFLREDLPISPGDRGENDATEGIPGKQPSKGNTDTLHIKQEDLQSYCSKVALREETSVDDTNVAKNQAGEDDWIEENEIEGGCVYDVQIKEEVMDDGYQENQATGLQDDDDNDEDIEDDGEDKNKHSSSEKDNKWPTCSVPNPGDTMLEFSGASPKKKTRYAGGGFKCSVGGCGKTYYDGYSMHELPKQEGSVRREWMNFLKASNFDPDGRSLVHICSGHFDRSQYDETQVMMYRMKIRKLSPRLKPTAIPSFHKATHPFPPDFFKL
ncbi:uncharacterized protein LOC129254873 isoform X2 [Lytechinus pictus]|uniref:uncharacterized protein LOC129254873 isoform X2 n=1 Tax=Lytechinus pictus TaxID=7653 RepID=UPI0030B9CC39